MNARIPEIMNGLKIFDGIYKRELVDRAIELKDDISPYLIEILENVLSEPDKYVEDSDLLVISRCDLIPAGPLTL